MHFGSVMLQELIISTVSYLYDHCTTKNQKYIKNKLKKFEKQILENYIEGESVILAGRLMRRKIQGKASFGSLQDSKGKIQIYLNF